MSYHPKSSNNNRVVFLSHYFYPRIGGVEKHVYQVSQELIKRGYQIIVVTSQYDNNLPDTEVINNIKIIRIKLHNSTWQRPSKYILWAWMIQNINLFKSADTIHCHDVFFWYLPLRFLLPQKKVYITFHGYEGVYPPKKKAILVRKISEKITSGNLCVGNYIKKWYKTKPDLVTYGGTQIPIKILPFTHKKSALYLGRIDQDSGIRLYFAALRRLQRAGINIKVEFCGGGVLEDQVKNYGKLLGFQRNISKYLLRNRFAFVSSYLAILEAMAHKRLVFAVYDNPIKKDIILFSPFVRLINYSDSANKLVKQIKFYLNNPKAETEMVTKAFEWVKTQSWSKVVDKYERLWSKK